MNTERRPLGDVELVDNGDFSCPVSLDGELALSVEKAKDLEGWWLVRPATDGQRPPATLDRHDGTLRLSAGAGVSLLQRLRRPASSGRLACRIRVHRGTVEVGVSNAAGTYEEVRDATPSSQRADGWQTVTMDVAGPAEQVMIRAATDIIVDVAAISLRPSAPAPESTHEATGWPSQMNRATPNRGRHPMETTQERPAAGATAPLAAAPPVTISLRPPPDLHGGEPGAALNLEFDYDFGPGIVDLQIDVSVDGISAPPQTPTGDPCQVSTRVYRTGTLQITYRISGWDMFNKVGVSQGPLTGSVNVLLDDESPRFTVDVPHTAPIGIAGGAFPIVVHTSSDFGPRSVSWTFEDHAGSRPFDFEDGTALPVSVDADATPLGSLPLNVTVSCDEYWSAASNQAHSVEVTDFTGPSLVISQPSMNQQLRFADLAGATVTVAGSASDSQSGMRGGRVQVSPTGRDDDFADAATTDGWISWTAAIPIDDYGDYTVHVRGYDAAGNATTTTVDLSVVSTYVPATLEERLSDQEYLAALLTFSHDQLESAEHVALTTADLETVFGQPFYEYAQPLSASATTATKPVNELRPTIELLRRRDLRLLAADWAFDIDVTGGTVGDLSGWNQTVTLSSGATVVTGAGPDGEAVLRLDGTASSGAVTGPDLAGIGAAGSPFSIVFNFRLAGAAAKDKPRILVAKGDSPGDATFIVGLNPESDTLEFAAFGAGGTTATPVPSDDWVHVACVCTEDETRIYFDGACIAQNDRGPTATGGSAAIRIGSFPDGGTGIVGATGDFGRTRIYNFALDDAAISGLAAATSDRQAARLDDLRSAAMAQYCLAAYELLLAGAGTSYAELRLTAADKDARAALATRLGVTLSGTPDQLTLLTAASPGDVTEGLLETTFGLRSTDPTLDPERAATTPLLQQWRQATTEARWVAQDQDPLSPPLPVLVDPDLISEADLSPAGAAGAPGRLLINRRSAVAGWTADLHTKHTTATTPAAGFAAMLDYTYGHATTLDSIRKDLADGVNISSGLTAARLTPTSYRALNLIGQLCVGGSVTDEEWTTAEQILTQVLKLGQYDAWHKEEHGLALTPALFDLATTEPELTPWRADTTARLAWRQLLGARVAERDSDSAGYAAYLSDVEQATLQQLRDALLDGVAGTEVAPGLPDFISRLLALDVARSGAQQTTRILAVIDVLQTILFTTRFGRWPEGHPFGRWKLSGTLDEFDAEWRWLGNVDSWATAVTAYLFPESWLDPALLPDPSAAFASLVRSTRTQPSLDPDSARMLAAQFFDARRDDFEAKAYGPIEPKVSLLFGQSSGTQITDGVTGWTGTCSGNVGWVDGLYGTAALFEAPAASIDLDHHADQAPADISENFTICMWVAPTATIVPHGPGTGEVIGLTGQRYAYAPIQGGTAYAADHAGVGVSVGTNGVSVYEHGDDYLACVATYEGRLDDWTHVGVVYYAGKPTLYVNGKLVATGNTSPKVVHALPAGLGNGPEHYGQYLGNLQNVRVFDRPRDGQDEMAALAYRPTDQRDQAGLGALEELVWALMASLMLQEPPYLQPAGEVFAETFFFVPALLAQRLQSSGEFEAALAWWQTILDYQGVSGWRYSPLQNMANKSAAITFGAHWAAELNPHAIAASRPNPYVRYTLGSIAACLCDYATSKFATDTSEQIAEAKVLYDTANDLLGSPSLQVPPTSAGDDPVYPNPYVTGLQQAVAVQIAKLRQARYVTGDVRVIPSDLGASMRAAPPTQPTPYHFKALLDRAQQVLASAQNVEGAYLHALEMYDDRAYRRFEAQNGIDTANQQVQIQLGKQTAAADGVDVARLQKNKADLVAQEMQDLIDAGLNMNERYVLDAISNATSIKQSIVNADTVIGLAGYAAQAAAAGEAAPAVAAINVAAAAGSLAKADLEGSLNTADAQMQSNQLLAGFERQKDNWIDTQAQAIQDSIIGTAQVTVAKDQLTIATQETMLAQLQLRQAQATVSFLDQQFTNADLYQYMSGLLGGVYASLLQEATVLARQAEVQLAFERQIPAPGIVQSDYWSQSQSLLAASTASGSPNLRGLTGAERLLQDVDALMQYSMSSDQRRLNLTQTFSLATLQPLAFATFLDTGVLDFATPSEWFDQAFPGHYLRLISQVRVSVVALIPPDVGLRATLRDNGLSRVVSGGDVFTEHTTIRTPDTVALTSPAGATGVFTLDRQPELLQPFESRGVVTSWRFEMPLPANPIDYGSIADVMLSIDYTALYDGTYRAHVIQKLNTARFSADRIISVRSDRPDAWYALNNPDDPTSGSTATLTLMRSDFTSQVTGIPKVADLAAYLPGASTTDEPQVSLQHGGKGGLAQANDQVISTLRGNAEAWKNIRNEDATGDWTIYLDKDTTAAIRDGSIRDIIIDVTYTGPTPQWTS